MSLTNEEYMNRLNECMIKKKSLLNEIVLLTKGQESFIENEDYDSLNKMIDKKQEKIEKVDKVDDEFEVYFKRLKANLKVKSLDEINPKTLNGAAELKQSVIEIFSILKEIQEFEKQNKEKAEAALNQVKDGINRVKASKRANVAYLGGKSSETESHFIDSKK